MRSHNDGGRRLRCAVHHVPLAKRTSDFGRDMVLPGEAGVKFRNLNLVN